ncbi:hypothetical protein FQA39_LY03491 [Lamprigera yunnana]|nr:hypothetical protein FQA39_LY03491 [Lamprigera yunnana]
MLKLVILSVLLNLTHRNTVVCISREQPKEVQTLATADSNAIVSNAHAPDGNEKSIKQEEVKPKEVKPKEDKVDESKSLPKNNAKTSNSSTFIPIRERDKNDLLQSGALLRGFYVFLGLSVLTVFYFVYRSYRLRHGSQPSTTVKKYGVTARRSDLEMRPLELDDDDDDTLFEVNNQNANR